MPGQSGNCVPSTSPAREGHGASARLKVCHVVATTEGASWMLEQLRELRDRHGFDVAAVVSGEQGALVRLLDSERIPHFAADFDLSIPRGALRMPLTVLRLARLFRRERFDVVQTHIFVTMIFGRVAAWLADAPVRLSMIAGPFHLKAHASRLIDRSTAWMETALVPSCEQSRRLCREMGVSEDRLPLIYYSADERRFDPAKTPRSDIRREFGWPDSTPLVGMVAYFYPRLPGGRLVPEFLHGRGIKGHEDLIEAAPLILEEFPEAKILLVGGGWGERGSAYMEELRELVRLKGLEQSVVFAGYRADVNSVLRELDVAVQASLDENLGGTIEALLMECPLVATRVGGMVDTVRDGETGLLANPSDPRDLAARIKELLRDKERARSLGRAGRRLILERFTLERTAQDLSDLYRNLASDATRRREFYNPLVSLLRLALLGPFAAWLGFRLLVTDLSATVREPARFERARALPLRFYRLLRRALRGEARGAAVTEDSAA